MKHTPTPWMVDTTFSEPTLLGENEDLIINRYMDLDQRMENLKFIVKACNSHEQLLLAAKSFLNILNGSLIVEGEKDKENFLIWLGELIKKAEGE